jgi:hypothetical protein
MLHREEPDGLVVIAQPAHAWITGQLARAWGNERMGMVEPWEEVCLAAEQHDLGWTAWEAAPTLNTRTGRPHSFMQMPRLAHLAIWSSAAAAMMHQSRYAALLVSMHGTGLYEAYDPTPDTAEERAAVVDFLAQQRAFQAALLADLRADPVYAAVTTSALVRRNQQLIAAWDRLSLALCMGVRSRRVIDQVPTAIEPTALTLTPLAGDATRVAVAPWPFRTETVTLVFDGRRLATPIADGAALRPALAGAPWLTIVTHLQPA